MDIGGSARDPQGDEETLVLFRPLALDALAIVVHEDVPLGQVDLAFLRRLYMAPEPLADLPVTRVSKVASHGTYQAFQAALGLKGVDLAADVQGGSNGEILAFIEASRGIGYVSLADATRAIAAGQPLRILPIEGQLPSVKAVATGSYPLVRTLYLVVPRPTTKRPRRVAPAAVQFLDFLESPDGQTQIREAGFLPAPARSAQ